MIGAKQKEMFDISDLRRRETFHLRSVCPPGERGVLWYFPTYIGSGYFCGYKIFNYNIFFSFQKTEYFCGYEDFVDIFLGPSQIWTIFLGLFWRSSYRMEDIFWVAKISNIYLMVDAGPEPSYDEQIRVPPPTWGLSISSNLSLINAYKWAFVLVGFCPSGLLS